MKILAIALAVLVLLLGGSVIYYRTVVNDGVAEDLLSNPAGERAEIVMLLTFPHGKTIPVNYLREGRVVYCGADGPWWREFQGDGKDVKLLIQGEKLSGRALVELENHIFIDKIFSRLRPNVPSWLPRWLNGRLIVIQLD